MERRRIVIILGRDRDIEGSKFGLQFSLCGLVDEGQFTPVLAALRKLLVAKTDLIFDEGDPASSDVGSFKSHKVYA
jgi:hypothetical protein